MNDTTKRSGLREPMVWLVAGLPIAAVVAGILTVIIAVRAGGADAVIDPVARAGKAQVADLSGDTRAAELGLSAQLRFDRETGALRLQLSPADTNANDALQLRLVHPTDGAADVDVPLVHAADAWVGRVDPSDTGDWNLLLTDAKHGWQLKGRLTHDRSEAHLQPALAGH